MPHLIPAREARDSLANLYRSSDEAMTAEAASRQAEEAILRCLVHGTLLSVARKWSVSDSKGGWSGDRQDHEECTLSTEFWTVLEGCSAKERVLDWVLICAEN